MAIFEANDKPYDMTNLAEVMGTPENGTPTGFDLITDNGELVEITGFGFVYDGGDVIGGTVTSIDWMPSEDSPFDFTISNISWDITEDVGDTGFIVDGQTLFGTAAEHALWFNGNDQMFGSAMGDTLFGFAGNDSIEGGDGDDELQGWSGNDTLRGGAGNDTLLGGAGSDFLSGGTGDDHIDGGAILDRVNYTDVNTVSYEDHADAVVVDLSGITGDGSVGQGTATSAAGNDVLVNTPFVRGGSGNDSIRGSSANIFEMIEGGGGNDTLDGGAITDLVNGTNNNRVSFQTAGAAVNVDLATGTATGAATGTDTLSNFNQVRGSAHNDTLSGTDRSDLTEHFDGRAGDDIIHGKGGFDIVRYDGAGAAVTVNLGTQRATGGDGNDTLSGIEGVFGSNHNDTLIGSNATTGLEVFRGGAGADSIVGGLGTDRADYGSSNFGVNVNLGSGLALNDGYGSQDTLEGIENVRGSTWNDSIVGNAGNNLLEGQAGIDTLVGGDGNDTLLGGEGQDLLIGGTGNDSIDGGAITDRINYSDLNILSYGGDTRGVNVNLSGISGDGSTGQGSVTARSTLSGNSGTDVVKNVNYVITGSGADSIVGSSADIFEMFDGGAGNDTINGGAINSVIGVNRVTYANAASAVNVNLSTGVATGAATGTDTLSNINQVRGSAHNDTLTGSDRTDFTETFEGRSGSDFIDGRGGYDVARYDQFSTGPVMIDLAAGQATMMNGEVMETDTLAGIEAVYGTGGDDFLMGGNLANGADWFSTGVSETFRGGAGNDVIDGGVGLDRAEYVSSTSGVHVDLNTGVAQDGLGGTDSLSNIEGVRGSDHNDTLIGTGRESYLVDGYVEFFEGNAGSDSIAGGAGIDAVHYTTSTSGVNVNLQTATADDGMGGTDTIEGIEFARGSNHGDTIVGANGFTVVEGMGGNDHLTAGDGDDRAYGGDGNDTVLGLEGNDSIEGGNGNDLLEGGDGNDSLRGGAGDDTLLGGAGDDVLFGEAGNDSMVGGAGYDHFTTVVQAGNDTMDGGAITDRVNYTDRNSITYLDQTVGVTINLSGISGDGSIGQGTATSSAIGTDVLKNINFITGSLGNDSIVGSSAMIFEQFEGGAGNDTIDGGAITDLVNTDNSNRVTYQFVGSAVNVNLTTGTATGGGGSDVLRNISAVRGSNHNDTLTGSDTTAYSEQFEGRNGNDIIDGKGGFDLVRYEFDGFAVNVDLAAGTGQSLNGEGTVVYTDTFTNIEGAIGSTLDDTLTGGNSANGTTYTDGKQEVFRGNAGDDLIDGGQGVDRADYTNSDEGVHADLETGEVSDGFGTTDTLTGIEGIRGSTHDDTLLGSNRIDDGDGFFEFFEGREGNDSIDGRDGTDWVYYHTSRAGVNVNLQDGVAADDGMGGIDGLAGIEAVRGSTFADVIVGADGGTTLEGLAGNDNLAGGDGDDLLVGGAGNDTMSGGDGNDTYNVDSLSDSVVEAGDAGFDSVLLNLSVAGTYNVALNVEEVIVSAANPASTLAIHVTGNASDNLIVGNAAANRLDGGAGNDTLQGGLGNDTLVGGAGNDFYQVNASTDVISETLAGEAGGYDVVELYYSGSYTLGANIEEAVLMAAGNSNLTGNTLDNWLDGNTGNNSLSGGTGDDVMVGNGGDDTMDGGAGADFAVIRGNIDDYTVSRPDAVSTVLTHNSNGDVIVLRNVESVVFDDEVPRAIGELHANTASAFDDTISGDEANDSIDGLAGNDSIFGDAGDDTLLGGLGNDTLEGGTGNDSLVGGAGNDLYVVDSDDDVVVEAAAAGTDTVLTSLASYTLGANVENLAYSGFDDFEGTGNAGANIIAGWTGNDLLDGGLGDDTLEGDDGDDTYVINVATDVVVERADEGTDTVYVDYLAAGSYTLTANVEDATAREGTIAINLAGNALDNRLQGNEGNNSLSGADGADMLIVTGGNDTLDGGAGLSDAAVFSGNREDWGTVSRPNATDIRLTNGTTTVTLRNIETFTFDDGVLSLSDMLENSLSAFNDSWEGTEGDDDSTDALAGNDLLDGKGGNDTLNGGIGNDTMIGGTGDDTFIVNVATDVVTENDGEGTDEVIVTAAGTFTLADNVENATISTSVAGVRVTGNSLDNVLTGGSGANLLTGLDGNDTLDGGLGTDTLVGGTGNDHYVINTALDAVTEAAGAGDEDRVELRFTAAGSYTLTANVEEAWVNSAANIAVNVAGNALNNDIIGHAGNNSLSGGAGDDILEGNGGNDTLDGGAGVDEGILKGALEDYTVTRVSTTQTKFVHTDGTTVTMTGIENLVFYGAGWEDESDDTALVLQDLLKELGSPGNDTLTGSDESDALAGGAGNDLLLGNGDEDFLDGGAGADTLRGGAGSDLLLGGTGGDTYQFGAGGGNDMIRENDATASIIDTVVIDAESGNLAGGEVRIKRSSDDADDLVITITSGDGSDVVDTLTIDEFFLNDAVNKAGAIEAIRFTDGNVTLTQAQILTELLKGSASDDWIRGYGTNDSINGLEGDDVISGGNGNDTLIGNWGHDDLSGDAGSDLLQGNLGEDILSGGAGNDILDGGAGADQLFGDDGNDVMLGGAANDILDGGAGLDTLTGGAGSDVLTGGDGNDRFVLNSLTGTDIISDFASGADKIAINKSVFTEVTGAVSATPTTLAGLGDAFAYDEGTGQLTYDADGDGGDAAIIVAEIQGGGPLAADFLIIG